MKPLPLTQVPVQRLSLTSDKPFATVLAAIRGGIGHPDMTTFWEEVWNADSFQKVESIVKPALGPTGLMQFGEFDDGGSGLGPGHRLASCYEEQEKWEK